MWCGCLAIRFDRTKDAAVQAWFKEHAASSSFSSVSAMARLPQAADLAVEVSSKKVGLWRFAR